MTIVKRIGEAHLVINIIDYNQKTIFLILPGGGYHILSNRESGPVATSVNMEGYNSAILYYTCKPLIPYEEGKASLKELSKDFKNIVVIGFSAGGHLASLLATTEEKENLKAAVLCYPVISLKEYTHEETAKSFLGNDLSDEKRLKYSGHTRVNSDTVPTFIWTTKDDEIVPYENTLMMAEALKKYNILNQVLIFDSGVHGLALANETAVVGFDDKTYNRSDIAIWFKEAIKFIKKVVE